MDGLLVSIRSLVSRCQRTLLLMVKPSEDVPYYTVCFMYLITGKLYIINCMLVLERSFYSSLQYFLSLLEKLVNEFSHVHFFSFIVLRIIKLCTYRYCLMHPCQMYGTHIHKTFPLCQLDKIVCKLQ